MANPQHSRSYTLEPSYTQSRDHSLTPHKAGRILKYCEVRRCRAPARARPRAARAPRTPRPSTRGSATLRFVDTTWHISSQERETRVVCAYGRARLAEDSASLHERDHLRPNDRDAIFFLVIFLITQSFQEIPIRTTDRSNDEAKVRGFLENTQRSYTRASTLVSTDLSNTTIGII